MSLDARENRAYLKGHTGPHSKEYHQEVHRRLEAVLSQCHTQKQCRSFLVEELKKIADDACTPGSQLHRLLMKT